MAQADVFNQFITRGGVLDQMQQSGDINMDQYNDSLRTVLNNQMGINNAKKKMLKADTDSLNVFKRIQSVGSNILKQLKENNDLRKNVKKSEDELNKLQAARLKAIRDGNTELAKALKNITKQRELELEMSRVSLEQLDSSIPILGSMSKGAGKFLGVLSSVGMVVGMVVTTIVDIAKGIFKIGKAIFKAIMVPIKKAFNIFLELQGTVGNIAADIGLTKSETIGLTQEFAALSIAAMKYGGSMKDVATAMQQFSEITGKNRIFDEGEIEQIVELGLATNLGVQGASEIASSFDNIGVSLSRTIKLTDKARNFAAKLNLNSGKVVKTYGDLVKSLTGTGFARGLDNLTKIAAKANAIRFDIVKSTESFTDAFFEPEKAVEAAAQMQVLGGKFAQSFGDPMQLAFESMTDPVLLAEKFAKSVSEIVAKDSKGNYFIPPAERKALKIAAETLGQNYEDAVATAIEQKKIADKMVAVNKAGISMMSLKEDQKLALASLMTLNEDNKFEIAMSDGTKLLLENVTSESQIKQILDARQKNEDAAIMRLDMMKRLSMIVDRMFMGFSKVFAKLFGGQEFDSFLVMVEKAGESITNFILNDLIGKGGLTETFKQIMDEGKRVFDNISKLFSEDGNGTFVDRLVTTMKTLVKEFLIPTAKSLFDYAMPLIEYTFGMLLSAAGDVIPGWMGGNDMKRKGLELQMGALTSNSEVMKTLMSKEQRFGEYNKMQKDYQDVKKSLFRIISGAILTNSFDIITNPGKGFSDIGTSIGEGIGKNTMYQEKDMNEFQDGIIYKDGSYSKFSKGDMIQFIDQNAMERAIGGLNYGSGGGSGTLTHSGTIIIKSDDGKVVTWDQMYAATDLVGSRISSISQSYNNGFKNYQNPSNSPIQPLL